jgi:OOP family OmpA-OmpF porin
VIRLFKLLAVGGALALAGATFAQDDRTEGLPQTGLENAKGDPGDLVLRIGFTFGRSEVPETVRRHLDSAAERINSERASAKIEVAGHTDSLGPAEFNQHLSEQRAAAVKAYLVEHGIDAGRISVIGYGEARPRGSNDTVEGRRLNRRVEIRVIG